VFNKTVAGIYVNVKFVPAAKYAGRGHLTHMRKDFEVDGKT